MGAPATESLVALFRTRSGPTHDFLVALDKSLYVIARSRGVPALEADLPVQLEDAGDRLAELAHAAGDLGLATEIRTARTTLPLYVSAYPAVDVTDPPMPTFATRRVVVAAYMVYTEALLMHIQTLYAGWCNLTRPLALHDGSIVGTNRVPHGTESALRRWVGEARRVAAKLRGLDTAPHAASFDADVQLRQTFLGLSAAVGGLAESMCMACACLLDAQAVAGDLRVVGTRGAPRLEAGTPAALDAVLACALGLRGAAASSELLQCAYVGLSARVLRWRLDVDEMARLYIALFWALACDHRRLADAVRDWQARSPTATAVYARALDELARASSRGGQVLSMSIDPFGSLVATAACVAPLPPCINDKLNLSRR